VEWNSASQSTGVTKITGIDHGTTKIVAGLPGKFFVSREREDRQHWATSHNNK
jgi:hypothetical protein